jgi:hypothetical protein
LLKSPTKLPAVSSTLKRIGSIVLVALVTLPAAAVATFLLIPVWSWFERVSAVESIGHSGPATWCFVATYGLIFAIGLSLRRLIRGESKEKDGDM